MIRKLQIAAIRFGIGHAPGRLHTNGAIYKGSKDRSGNITMERHAESLSLDEYERKVHGVDYHGRVE